MVAAFAAVCSFAQSRTTLWEGEQIMDATWPNIGVELSNLATAKAGDNIVVTVSKVDASINSAWEWGSQVFLKVNSGADGGWVDMEGTSAVGLKEPGEAKFEITDKALEQFKGATSFFVQGMCVVVSKVELESTVATASTQIWSGECVSVIGQKVSMFLLKNLLMLPLATCWSLFILPILIQRKPGGSLKQSSLVQRKRCLLTRAI